MPAIWAILAWLVAAVVGYGVIKVNKAIGFVLLVVSLAVTLALGFSTVGIAALGFTALIAGLPILIAVGTGYVAGVLAGILF